MTCIIALKDYDQLIIGADSLYSRGECYPSLEGRKLVIKDNVVYGICGNPRILDLLEYSFIAPKQKKGQSNEAFMSTTFIDTLVDLLDPKGLIIEDDDGSLKIEGDSGLLVVYKNEVYVVYNNLFVKESECRFSSIGIGGDMALAVVETLVRVGGSSAESMIKEALTTVAKYFISVSSPFSYVRVSKNGTAEHYKLPVS